MPYQTLAIILVGSYMVIVYYYLFSNKHSVVRMLRKHGVKYDEWVKSSTTNSLHDLIESTNTGESWLESCPDGRLICHINVSVVTVTCSRKHAHHELREFRDGKRRPFKGSLGEKIRENFSETPIAAAKRGLIEELGKTEPSFKDPSMYEMNYVGYENCQAQPSEFYPGLYDQYHWHQFVCDINPHLYRNKYVAEDNGRQIHFHWIDISNS